MPTNKDALGRYRLIDEALRNRQVPFPSKLDLIHLIEARLGYAISERTLEEDLSNMRNNEDLNYLAPIAYDKNRKGYYYQDSAYSITGIPITKEDLKKLKYVLSVFSNFKGIPYLAEIFHPIEQLDRMMHMGKSTGQWINNHIMQLEIPEQWPDKAEFEKFFNAIVRKNTMEISYQRFGAEASDLFTIHPYLLKEFRNRWYLVAYNLSYGDIRVYGLDRIRTAIVNKSQYTEHFDAEEYFKYALGITVQNKSKPVNIELLFSEEDAYYILSNRLHQSQRVISRSKKGLKIGLTLHPSYELTMLIRSYGSGVKVLKPKWLREEQLEEARRVLEG